MSEDYRFTFRADQQLARAIKAFCKEEEVKPSQLVRKAVKDFIKSKKQQPATR